MTKIVTQSVKCAKCGKESTQQIVYSVNFAIGSMENNKKLIEKKQKCPHCGYEAPNIAKNCK